MRFVALVLFCAAAFVCSASHCFSAEKAAVPAVATVAEQPVVNAEPARIIGGSSCPGGNCHPQSPAPQQPQTAEPPKFDMPSESTTSIVPDVPTGLIAAVLVACAVVGGGTGVAVQWKATYKK
jgi:hypothetical protein